MARKPAPKKTPANLIAKPPGAPAVIPDAEPIATPVAETAVRKTVAPKAASPVAKKTPAPLTYERIAERAYYISQSPACSSEFDNWLRAESELKSETV